MERTIIHAALALLLLSLAACGGGGDGSSPPPPAPANQRPQADAGEEQRLIEGDEVTLDGSKSSDTDGFVSSYTWRQISGPAVALNRADTAEAVFTAPDVATGTVLRFELTVIDDAGARDTDTTVVTVEPSNTRVFTDLGIYEGVELGDGVRGFLGVGFARPPASPRRWSAPEAPQAFEGVRPVNAFGPNCFQIANPDRPGEDLTEDISEDCLYLNIWTLETDAEADLPVMVWIHGGGNQNGSGSVALYDGLSFARDQQVVLVTLNYRLGPLGYLGHEALNAEAPSGTSGNYGLLDIIAALEWVRAHIAPFGGDPDTVMIFGESAGAVNTCNMIASPLAEGLFHRAAMQSGDCSASLPDLFNETEAGPSAVSVGEEAAVALGCDGEADVLACMRAVPPEELYDALDPVVARFFGGDADKTLYAPITDGYVLPGAPETLLQSGEVNPTPLLVGANADEAGLWRVQIEALITGVAAYEFLVEDAFDDDPDLLLNGPSAEVIALYPASTEEEAEDAFKQLFGDASFVCNARRAARAMSALGEPVWMYNFQRVPPFLSAFGAFHGAEIPYVFNTLNPDSPYAPADEALARELQGYWANFARTGDPDGPGLPNWPPYYASTDEIMVLDAPLSTDFEFRKEKCDLLDRLGTTP